MKYLITFCLLISTNLFAFAEKNEMIPLPEYIENLNGNYGSAEKLYISYRCVAMYSLMTVLMDGTSDAFKQQREGIREYGELAMMLSEIFYNQMAIDGDFETHSTRLILPMMDNYRLETDKSWADTGQYFNSYIYNDVEVCKNALEGAFEGLDK
ncbi:MAG: hypothetical protein O3C35_04175 [Proteobacteria bacterium]|nr:hypothetical protein [Pseudomonadota bacterium]